MSCYVKLFSAEGEPWSHSNALLIETFKVEVGQAGRQKLLNSLLACNYPHAWRGGWEDGWIRIGYQRGVGLREACRQKELKAVACVF